MVAILVDVMKSFKLKRRINPYFGTELIEPVDKKDLWLFSHCAGGMVSVTEYSFEKYVKPLLELHGYKPDIKPDTKTDESHGTKA